MTRVVGFLLAVSAAANAVAADLPASDAVKPVRLFDVDQYSEGVVFDATGAGFISHGKKITRFTVGGEHETWVELAGPNGHKSCPTGRTSSATPGGTRSYA